MAFFQTDYDSPTITIALFSFLGALIYFAPSLIAVARRHHRKQKIFLLNIIAGWTVIGWIGALAWSLMPVEHTQRIKKKKRSSILE